MRQKELRLALVCYGGVSLAVYMHGVTKEIWHLARASRAFQSEADAVEEEALSGSAEAYCDFLKAIERECGLRLRVMPDILTGASAGGINAVFLAQAIATGQSLEPLTDLWLSNADVSELTDPDAEPMWRYAKIWAQPIAEWFLSRPGNAVSESVSPETREEVRHKVSRLVRGRWFSPPFSGDRFSAMLFEALETMAAQSTRRPLLPPDYPIDLLVTTTDFRGHIQLLRLNSPEIVQETEHRLPIGFRAAVQPDGSTRLADPLELVLAARATASFPGAFPPLRVDEIDRLAAENGHNWASRETFLERIMPVHFRDKRIDTVSLIDGSVLVNAPFGGAIAALKGRQSQREVDRRFVYIDPRPDRIGAFDDEQEKPIGFFAAIFGSISTIPREQPIRDDLERIERQSRDAQRLRRIVLDLRPEIDAAVEKLFGYTFFLDRPNPKRLANWRAKAQQAAAEKAGFAFHAYAQTKFTGIVDRLATLAHDAAPEVGLGEPGLIADRMREHLRESGLHNLSSDKGGATEPAIAFFRAHDVGFRIRRLQLLIRKASREWELDPDIPDEALNIARDRLYATLALYIEAEERGVKSDSFKALARDVMKRPERVLEYLSQTRLLPETDLEAERNLSEALEAMPKTLRQRMLLTYLGFPYYDIATFPLLQRETLSEFNPVQVDRISPDDARSIRDGGTRATLRGVEFYNFGAFFSRAYRENDYIWGRLHGAERMVDIVASTVDGTVGEDVQRTAKRAIFLAILEEEEIAGRCARALIETLRREVEQRLS
ncbi:MAG: patatin-like protein [Erythrobacter sp.]|uniref:patatin-like protein n=1 Tax=Erythrobacter sp. TaxID=1042 RepID=UPI00262CA1C5|nr:patatin-like protein [Erythrobacter sp.]MDJ0977720.1 patatin-like protein [Erythrobacter sp.]